MVTSEPDCNSTLALEYQESCDMQVRDILDYVIS